LSNPAGTFGGVEAGYPTGYGPNTKYGAQLDEARVAKLQN
jgi:hypothetical protein